MIPKVHHAVLAVLSVGMFAYLLSAQAAPPAPRTLAPTITQVDVSRPPAPGQPHAPISVPRHFANPALLGRVKAALVAANGSPNNPSHGKPTPTPNSTPSPLPSPAPISSGVTSPVTVTTGFDAMGLFDGGGFVPPDTTVAAGSAPTATMLLEAVNTGGTVYDTAGAAQVSLNTAACTTNSSNDSVSDPRVLFDAASGRWFISTTTFSPSADSSWNLLFSMNNDPTSPTWNCLIIPTSTIRNPDGTTGNFPDFPKIGINTDKVVLTGDAFSPAGHGHQAQGFKFQGTEFVVIDKSKLLSGTVAFALSAPNQGDFAIEPAQQLNSTTETLYMAAVNSSLASTSTLDVWAISGVPGALQTNVTRLTIGTLSLPPNAQQQGTSVLIDTNDDSLLDAVFRDGTPGSLWVSANDACTPPGDSAVRSCLRFINVSIGATGMSVAQDFDYGDAGTYYYYPAVRTDSAGDLFAAFSGSSASSFASAYAGVQSAGITNALSKLSVIRAGDSPYTVSPPRWGDYSGAGVDPGDTSVWLGAEYATQFSIFGPIWGTAIAHAQP
jgi:hypothetical protein